jgi:hypothetical protein
LPLSLYLAQVTLVQILSPCCIFALELLPSTSLGTCYSHLLTGP